MPTSYVFNGIYRFQSGRGKPLLTINTNSQFRSAKATRVFVDSEDGNLKPSASARLDFATKQCYKLDVPVLRAVPAKDDDEILPEIKYAPGKFDAQCSWDHIDNKFEDGGFFCVCELCDSIKTRIAFQEWNMG